MMGVETDERQPIVQPEMESVMDRPSPSATSCLVIVNRCAAPADS